MNADLAALAAVLPTLSARDAQFATDLLAKAARWGLSEKQMFWVRKLAAPAPAAPAAPAADLSAIGALFAQAGGKRPRISFATATGTGFRLTVAGPRSSQPGSINVTSTEGDWEGRTWFGRVGLDGRFVPSRKVEAETTTAVVAALEAFAANPEAEARAYGFRTGTCAFCSHDLDNDASIALGYGPVCAKRWGLPHTYRPAQAA